MPTAIANNLRALAMALAPSDPQRAAAFLEEALIVAPPNQSDLGIAVFTAGRLGDWPGVLRAADHLLYLDRRSGITPLMVLMTTFNVVARGLAETQPESAAVLQGVSRRLANQAEVTSGPQGDATGSNPVAELITAVRGDTSQLLVAAIGEARMRDLRAQGEAMDRDQAAAYARRHIAEYVAAL